MLNIQTVLLVALFMCTWCYDW